MELAGLSFLGFGSQPPAPEWGLMLNEGRQQLQTAPWLMIFPGLAIFITVVIFNLWGDALRKVDFKPGERIQPLEGEIPSPLELPRGCPFQSRCECFQLICSEEKPELKQIAPGHWVACHLFK